jgi:hypothetical protein
VDLAVAHAVQHLSEAAGARLLHLDLLALGNVAEDDPTLEG